MTMKKLTCSFYVQFKPERSYWDKDRIDGMKAVAITQGKPSKPQADCVVVKFNASLVDEAFEQVPVVNADIPLSAVAMAEATVSA